MSTQTFWLSQDPHGVTGPHDMETLRAMHFSEPLPPSAMLKSADDDGYEWEPAAPLLDRAIAEFKARPRPARPAARSPLVVPEVSAPARKASSGSGWSVLGAIFFVIAIVLLGYGLNYDVSAPAADVVNLARLQMRGLLFDGGIAAVLATLFCGYAQQRASR